jgi:DNA polymerase-1
MARPTLYLVDAMAQIYRAFFAVRGFTTSKGLPTNAVYGFTTIMAKLLKEKAPDAVVVCFDGPGPTFRHERYDEYKSTRQKMPDELVVQLPYIRRLVAAMNLAEAEQEGLEADDLIGSLAKVGVKAGYDVVIVSGDKDMMQLVNDHVLLYDTGKDRVLGEEAVVEKFGVEPGRVTEVMGLMGDTSDNVPGIPGVGEVTARKLITQFQTLESVLTRADEISAKGVREKVKANADLARLSKELVTIHTDADVAAYLKAAKVEPPDAEALTALYRELEFASLLPSVEAEAPGEAAAGKAYRSVTDPRELDHLIARIRAKGEVSVDLETTSLNPLQADIVGVALALVPDEGYYVPVAHTGEGHEAQMDRDGVLEALRPVLESPDIAKIGQNLKYDLQVLHRAGVGLENVAFDTMIAAYLVSPNRRGHGMDALALEYLNHRTITYEEVAGKGAKQIPFAEVPVDKAAVYSAEDAEVTLCLKEALAPQLKAAELEDVFHDLEMPLLPVLARMERHGFLLDVPYLEALSGEMEVHIDALVAEIHALAGEEFNVASPKQLQVILFEKLGLKPIKKTKTGFSTDEDVLVQLAKEHPLPDKILALRQYLKLKGTYVDALPALADDEGRVHTSLNQTVAATGRLSSTDPNLQNIPIRTEEGRRIRRAFICPEGTRLVSADYNQIELRILAHLADDAALKAAFTEGDDIHRRTAAHVYGIAEDLVTPDMRRAAKAINFGIIYGMGAYSLAQDLGVPQREAKETIERYFATYGKVKAWIEGIQAEATERGFVRTMDGRRRQIPELASENAVIRAQGERLATNSVIQGTAADVIKRAMINIDARLSKEAKRLPAKMLLQIHDELVFEVPEASVEAVREMVREEMEGAAELSVPLTVDVGTGSNWEEAH